MARVVFELRGAPQADVSEDLKPNGPSQETPVSRREFGAVSLAAGLAVVAGATASVPRKQAACQNYVRKDFM